MKPLIASKKLSIKKRPGQYIVFNIPGTDVQINSINVCDDGVNDIGMSTKEFDGDPSANETTDSTIISKICFNM